MTTTAPAAAATAADVVDAVRAARAESAPLRIGAGERWLAAGAPVTAARRLDLRPLAGIVAYEAGDLTITARAATPLADIQRATAAKGQWLALDPPGGLAGTIGATIATGSSGPLAAGFGTARAQLLGCELVTGAGDLVRAGGRVVKNVAGFDLTRLMIGAWGTLGVLTEVTLRLRARPAGEATVAIALGAAADVDHALRWLRGSAFRPLAAELITPALATRLGLPVHERAVLLLRLGGNARALAAALDSARALGAPAEVGADVWSLLSATDADGIHTLRLSTSPSQVGALWAALRGVDAPRGLLAHACAPRGVVRCLVPPLADGTPDLALLGRLGALRVGGAPCTLVAERLPAALWGSRQTDAVTARLSAGLRRVFDPDTLLNPGIMGTVHLPSS